MIVFGNITVFQVLESPLVYNELQIETVVLGLQCSIHITHRHGLRTPNEGINLRYLKNWADVADKICFCRT